MARLHQHKIETYEQIHNSMSPIYAHAMRENFFGLEIYRRDDLLVMIKCPRAGAQMPESDEVRKEHEEWTQRVGECFAEFWKPMDEIFDLKLAGNL